MNTSVNAPAELDMKALEQDINQLRDETLATLGQEDANYIRRVIRVQRLAEIFGRIMLMLGFITPWLWVVGLLLLALSKILNNMEIGHNVMHGQYDWMNDPNIHSNTFDWDLVCDSGSWQRTHNYEHHTYTNIIGKDRDFGYGLLRMSDDFPWKPRNRFQVPTYIALSALFEWGVALHEMMGERVFRNTDKPMRNPQVTRPYLKQVFWRKVRRQMFKDYVFFPLIAGPMFLWVLVGNLLANLIRNLWTSTIIFCGHFTESAHTFDEALCQNESRGHWYYRQMLGSSNFSGPRWLHILSGHLSCQIEHHVFPDIPAHRYVEMAPKLQAIAKKHGLLYNTGSFMRQYSSVLRRLFKYSKRPSKLASASAA